MHSEFASKGATREKILQCVSALQVKKLRCRLNYIHKIHESDKTRPSGNYIYTTIKLTIWSKILPLENYKTWP